MRKDVPCVMSAVSISMPIVNKVMRNPRVLTSFEYYYECFRDFRFVNIIRMRTIILFAMIAILCVAMAAQRLPRLSDSQPRRTAHVKMNSLMNNYV